jgi:glycosyltransferase involved in cell wall biosynthesis
MPTKLLNVFVSAVFVFDERSANPAPRVKSLASVLKKHYANYEVVVVDNGINFRDYDKLKSILKEVACVRIIQLSKAGETDIAVFAGVEAAIGDCVCVLYNNDPIDCIPEIVSKLRSESDIVFGVATNLRRQNAIENIGAKIFYWYNRRFLKIDIPHGATYFIGMNRSAVNALTRSGRYSKHIRYLSKQIGFKSKNYSYELPKGMEVYSTPKRALLLRAINLVSSYSSHPLRALTYFGVFAGVLNLIYAFYVVIIQLSRDNVAAGWTTLSLQSSGMFFLLFVILAMLSEYVGQILEESRDEAPYHIQDELSSMVSIADETRRNVTK